MTTTAAPTTAGAPAGELAMDIRGLAKHYDGVKAVDGVDLQVPRGQRHAIIGPNGAGKSTFFKAISGFIPATAGSIRLLDRDVTGWSANRIAQIGVCRTFQHSATFLEETLLDNCLIAATARASRGLSFRQLRRHRNAHDRAMQALESVGLADLRHEPAASVSHGQLRQLEIAMALAQEPQLLLADEPLAGLADRDRARIGTILSELHRDLTVVFVEHDLEFVLGLADQVTVLHLGELLTTGTPDEIRNDRRVQEVYIGGGAGDPAPPRDTTTPAVVLDGVSAGYGASEVLHDLHLEVPSGRVTAVLGRNGMGKTTLLHTMMGLVEARGGRITVEGDDVTATSTLQRARSGVALVPQGRGILPDLSVVEQLEVGANDGAWTVNRVFEQFPRLGERASQTSTTLSGGEQQMLAVGRALLRNPRVLLLDEPSEGLAPMIVDEVRDVVAGLAAEGETIVLAEQNVPMALTVADHVVVLDRGRIAWQGPAHEIRTDADLQRRLLGV